MYFTSFTIHHVYSYRWVPMFLLKLKENAGRRFRDTPHSKNRTTSGQKRVGKNILFFKVGIFKYPKFLVRPKLMEGNGYETRRSSLL